MNLHYRYRVKPDRPEDQVNIRGLTLTKEWYFVGPARLPEEFEKAAYEGILDVQRVETDSIYRGEEDWSHAVDFISNEPALSEDLQDPEKKEGADGPPEKELSDPELIKTETVDEPIAEKPTTAVEEVPVSNEEAPAEESELTADEPVVDTEEASDAATATDDAAPSDEPAAEEDKE